MKRIWALTVLAVAPALAQSGLEDPYLWLEEVEGERAVAWVRQHNEATRKVLTKTREYAPIFREALAILNSRDKIPYPTVIGEDIYNFWQDEQHVRGIFRRTSLAAYRAGAPSWETVLDLDALAAAEGVPWVFRGLTCLEPEYRPCLVALSRGGSDAVERREFELASARFVADGFLLPAAKSAVSFVDADTLWVATDVGPGSLTTSGYPRLVKVWRRGHNLASAPTLFEGEAGDVRTAPMAIATPEGVYHLVVRAPSFFKTQYYLALGERLVRLAVPEDAQLKGIFRDHLLLALRSEWVWGAARYREGSLLAVRLDDILRGEGRATVLFEPGPRSSLGSVLTTRDSVVFTTLDNVHSRLFKATLAEGAWRTAELPLPGLGSVSLVAASDREDLFFYTYEDFLTPDTLFVATADAQRRVFAEPAFFTTEGMRVTQLEATSKDGTAIPYFLVTPKGFVANGTAPTLLYGYGGFEVPQLPRYSAITGKAWLERGGVYVVANIRGGGEFGPAWHKAAIREHRITSFEDFIAVAEDLLARRITSSRHLGIMGGSQGGLLVGGAMTLRPDLFGAVVSQVPLADMRRFNKLLAGASWMAEYGNPDLEEEWAFIKTWSPYHLLRPSVTYPSPFFWTTTRDDRVHPAHARKMVARMEAMGHPVLYFEQIEGGHGAGAVNEQRAAIAALEYAYLWRRLR